MNKKDFPIFKTYPDLIYLDNAATTQKPQIRCCAGLTTRRRKGRQPRAFWRASWENVTLAREQSTPICQDTGTPIFYVHYPPGWSTIALRKQIWAAAAEATERSFLRPNAVDSLTGKNSGDNNGLEFPG